MFRSTIALLLLATYIVAQKSSKEAAILTETRYQNTAGQFGSSYIQEDGVEFKEESDSEGNRKGSYTYIDPNGQRKTISYTAGRAGFQATGDHLPVPPPAPTGSFPLSVVPQSYIQHSPISYQSSQLNSVPTGGLQVQYQTLPPSSIINPYSFFQVPAVPTIAPVSTEIPLVQSRQYPPAKLDVKQSPDGFSYTFNTIV